MIFLNYYDANIPPPLRVLELSLSVDPAFCPPRQVRVRYEHVDYCLSLEPFRAFENALTALLRQYAPDLVLTDYGDTWLLPLLKLNPNRDPDRQVMNRKAQSYFV